MILNMDRIKNIHLIGVGGCGVSAIAKILFQMGYHVSGSDIKESSNTIRLKDLGVKVYIEHDASHVRGADMVVVSSAIDKDNPEIEEALSRNIQIIKRAEMLAWIMDRFKNRVAVAGTHGKTTTSSMIAKIFLDAQRDPSYLVGGETDYVDGNARLGKGPSIIAEADESDGSFMFLNPSVTVITNIEEDHMDYYGSFEKIVDMFSNYVGKFKGQGLVVIEADHPNNRFIIEDKEINKVTYGFSDRADVRAVNAVFNKKYTAFDVINKGKMLGQVKLSIPGRQNILNALAALVVAMHLRISFSSVCSSLHSFSGARRRFQLIGEFNDVKVIDDYAHHPTEVRVTLQAARLGWGPDRRIIAIFQPHRFSRTFHLASEFGSAFQEADQVILTDIYSAGEKPIPNVDGRTLLREVENHHKNVKYIKRKEKIADFLKDIVAPGDIVITMGAGDIHTVCKELLARLKMKDNGPEKK
ncbi:MAG: UDP-N-acetylmuramate--L-alanine ligase [Candidatus Margulisiibacteriota bacterium]|nr:UDP-N-acetylmuramate--L-alanine ligase [Candidatus Margulisiibacteriota bacterium]